MRIRFVLAGWLLFILLLCTSGSYAQFNVFAKQSPIPKTGDEFVGPFNSWLNAKTGFGAAGNGTTDDTRALQAAFDAAANGSVNSTLFLPPGTYLITHTLTINHHINVSIVGADPNTTIIKWGGAAHGTMLQINGTAYSKFNRLKFNGNKIADVAVEQSWDGKGGHFDTGNEYADDIFVDVGFGIRGGAQGHGFAETSILRDQFIRNTSAGVSLGNFNALDIWIRNCLFQNCATGVTNIYGAGNFKVYNNIFRNSSVSDMSMNNTGEFSIRNNMSVNSNQFFNAHSSSNPASIIIQGNTVIDPVNPQAITIGNQGPSVFIDNTIRSGASVTSGPAVIFSHGGNSTSICLGNTFTVSNPIAADDNNIQYNNSVVSTPALKNIALKAFTGIEPNFNRKIFEVPKGANATAIQAIINLAAKVKGSRPVVHFPYGNFNIATTLFIPANTDMQLIGDGYGSQYAAILTWSSPKPGTIIAIAGPGKVTVRDLTLKGNPASTNMLITNADQPGSRVFLQEFNQSGGQTGMLINKLDHTLILGHDTEFSGLQKAISVIGGPLAAANRPAEGKTVIYSGAESNNALSHEILNGGNLMVQDSWYEGGIKSTYVKLTGNGIFTATGDHISILQHTTSPAVVVQNFTGKATFMANYFTDRFAISGNGAKAKILALSLMTENDPIIADTSSPKSDVRVLMSRTRDHNSNISRSGSYAIPNIGKYDQKFVSDMLINMLTVHSTILNALPAGVTDVRLYRVMSINGATGLDVEAGKN